VIRPARDAGPDRGWFMSADVGFHRVNERDARRVPLPNDVDDSTLGEATMRHAVLATLAAISITACSEAASAPTAVQTESLVATAADWTPLELTRNLQVDAATQERIDEAVRTMHASMLALHERHATAETLDGSARDAYLADLTADMQALHEQHTTLWESLDPAVQETLARRFHEQMRDQHGEEGTQSLHERMRSMHDGDHGAHDAGH
jgi:hypothetical protein